jgi:apolipoprotein N-acyltransferase
VTVTGRRPLTLAREGRWLALPLGALLAAAFAPLNWWLLAFLCPAALFAMWHGAGPRTAARRGFAFTAGTFLAGTYWIYHSVHLIGGAPVWIAILLMLGLVAIMGAYTALIGYGSARWGPPSGAVRWMLLLPAAWVLAEWLRGWVLSGFPWLALGYSQLDTALAGYAPLLGVYGVSLATAAIAGAIVTVFMGSRREKVIALVTTLLIWGVGAGLGRVQWTEPSGNAVSVALVQGAVPQKMKWDAAQRQQTLDLYRDLTLPHLGATIVLWPEAALPALERDLGDYLGPLRAQAQAAGTTLVTGLLTHDPATDAYYNGLVAYTPQAQWYHKRRLVPFGEFFPVPPFVREWMRLMNLPYSDMQPGADDQDPLLIGEDSLAPTICYEDAYGSEQLDLVRRSTMLVNVTNDAWFGDSTAPHQHLDISRMRSLETGRPMLRAANDGVTALIAFDGSLDGALPQFRAGVLTGAVQPRQGETPYVRTGNVPVLLLSMLGIVVAVFLEQRRTGKRRQP